MRAARCRPTHVGSVARRGRHRELPARLRHTPRHHLMLLRQQRLQVCRRAGGSRGRWGGDGRGGVRHVDNPLPPPRRGDAFAAARGAEDGAGAAGVPPASATVALEATAAAAPPPAALHPSERAACASSSSP